MTILLGEAGPGLPPVGAAARSVITGMELSSAAGSVDLLATARVLLDGTSGLTGPDSAVEVDRVAGADGGFVRGLDEDRSGLDLEPLDIYLALSIRGAADGVEVEQSVARLRSVLASRRYGPARLSVTRFDGQRRTLQVQHVPKRGDFDARWGFNSPVRHVVLRLLATDPLWRGASGSAGPWGVGGGPGLSLPFSLPVSLKRSSLLGQANNVVVGGDEITYPMVRVTGPATSVTVTRVGVGLQADQSWTITRNIAAGQSLFVNHDPMAEFGVGQVVGPDGSDWSRYLSSDSSLFGLLPGTTSLSTLVNGSGPTTEVAPTWETRYWSCLG